MKTISASSAATFELAQAGQSPWLDSISRQLLKSGALKSLIEEQGLLGVTSNPTIFEKAINTPGGGYEEDIEKLFHRGAETFEVYDALTVADIRTACDLFAEVHRQSGGEHGFVSLEVTPDLAHDAGKTIAEAERLFKAVGRPNVMIKVPATAEGIAAFKELTARGININVTLIFSQRHYREVATAYLEGLEELEKRGGDLSKVHSVASVFVSRFDTLIDGLVAKLSERETVETERRDLESLKGKAGVANSKLIYQDFKSLFRSDRFFALKKKGANVQKVLWGSTSAKNPAYPDLLYVETIVGRETVNTMPAATLEALLDHGKVRPDTVEEGLDEARALVDRLRGWGIDLIETGEKLQHDGLYAFMSSFDSLMRSLELMREARSKKRIPETKIRYSVPLGLVKKMPLKLMKTEKFIDRFFQKDAALWKAGEEHRKAIQNRLGWLRIPDEILGRLYEVDGLCGEVRREGLKDIVLLGMGGSSLAPEVMSLICAGKKAKRFYVLDTTDPASILALEKKISLKKALFIVASKSGTTVETISQCRYFFEKVRKAYGRKAESAQAGRHFVAITDDGSHLEQEAYGKHFRKVFINPSDIGGRYSALSFFGLVPAALTGVPVREVLKHARVLLDAAQKTGDIEKNSPFYLGALLGTLSREGRNQLTIWASRPLVSFGAWLEQLIAESTGKEGRGIIPVDLEAPAGPGAYGNGRVFLVLKLKGEGGKRLRNAVRSVKKAGFPVIETDWPSPAAIGAEFLRWEIATAVAGALLEINPFDEPNVKESKDNTTRLLAEAEKEGGLAGLEGLVRTRGPVPFEGFFSTLPPDGYVALLAYTERSKRTAALLARIQARIRNAFKVPVLTGFGPRYLHSIGQLYKGGPLTGSFILLIPQDAQDAPIPHAKFSFSELKRAQAIGDAQALLDRDRPLLAVDLGKSVISGLKSLEKGLSQYLKKRRKP